MTELKKPEQQENYPTLDLFRLIAAFGVILVHIAAKPTSLAQFLDSTFLLRVPFFLAATFYLFARYLRSGPDLLSFGLKLKNLILPTWAWSIAYLALRLANQDHRPDGRASALWTEWPDIVFFGGAYSHLYYISLLTIGLASMYLWWPACRSKGGRWLIVSVTILEVIIYSRHVPIPFAHISRLERVTSSLLACLPYAAMGMLLTSPRSNLWIRRRSWLEAGFWLILSLVLMLLFSEPSLAPSSPLSAACAVLVPTALLLAALKVPWRRRYLGKTSILLKSYFGIYLSHHAFIGILQGVNNVFHLHLLDVSTTWVVIVYGLCVFALSMATTFLCSIHGSLAWIVGIRTPRVSPEESAWGRGLFRGALSVVPQESIAGADSGGETVHSSTFREATSPPQAAGS